MAPRTAIVPVGMGNITALPWRQDGKSVLHDCNVGTKEGCQSKWGSMRVTMEAAKVKELGASGESREEGLL